jgi:hypothetical protein
MESTITVSIKKVTARLERNLQKHRSYVEMYGENDDRTKNACIELYACIDMVESFGLTVNFNEDGTVALA